MSSKIISHHLFQKHIFCVIINNKDRLDGAMMSKHKTVFICSECGYQSQKWAGKCPACGEWNTLTEEVISEKSEKKAKEKEKIKKVNTVKLDEIDSEFESRISTGIGEFDRVLGGGIVKGSLVLISGEPGIGKSTLLLQLCNLPIKVLYVSGEESPHQIKLRATRLGIFSTALEILSQTDVSAISDKITDIKPDLVIIDSIQTMCIDDMSSSPGSVPQVREATSEFLRLAKTFNIPIFIVGHVNKEGSIAGPKVMEHMVDTVLYFEGEKNLDCRILRAVKNRFGSTNEIGIFEMTSSGLKEIENPSTMFLEGKPINTSGISTTCIIEGSRPIIAEVQALAAQTPFPAPRRVSNGFDYSRLNLLIAVLEKRCGLYFGACDAYLNIIGGLRLTETAADLSVAMALASSLKDFIIPEDTVLIGELGLAGEVRAVPGIEKRIKECEKLGFKRCLLPSKNKIAHINTKIELIPVATLKETINKI